MTKPQNHQTVQLNGFSKAFNIFTSVQSILLFPETALPTVVHINIFTTDYNVHRKISTLIKVTLE